MTVENGRYCNYLKCSTFTPCTKITNNITKLFTKQGAKQQEAMSKSEFNIFKLTSTSATFL